MSEKALVRHLRKKVGEATRKAERFEAQSNGASVFVREHMLKVASEQRRLGEGISRQLDIRKKAEL